MLSLEDIIDRIICGDCIEVMRQIPSNSIDLVITSPPYNVGIKYDEYHDDIEWGQYFEWSRKWLYEIYRILKNDGRFCLNHYLSIGQSGNRHSPLMDLNWMAKEIGFKHHGLAVWTDATLTKRTAWGSWLSASAPYINSPYEGILILYKNKWKKERKGKSTISKEEFIESCSGIWNIKPDNKREKHPATFPEELPRRCINLLSYEGDIVMDPFNGIGTTTVVAKKLKRHYIGIEISENYCKIARERLKNIPDKRIDEW